MTPDPTNTEAFSDDALDRKKSAEFLTKFLVGRHAVAGSIAENASFVLNVNAEWGLGKTYFLQEWGKMLRAQGHFVVYFDAWENDYLSDPFVSFMSAINDQLHASLPGKGKLALRAKEMTKAGARVIKTAAPSIGLTVVKHFSGIDFDDALRTQLADAAKGASSDIFKSIKSDLEKQNKDLKKAIQNFKESFEAFISVCQSESKFNLPIFLMVDELDRCRPLYAIELLEKIKHIFKINNVYTIVATDSQQLSSSIKAIYGSEFESRKYLRRFFDHESRLEVPQFEQLANALLERRGLKSDERIENVLYLFNNSFSHAVVLSKIGQMMRVTTREFMRSIDILDTIKITSSDKIDLIFMSFVIMLYVSHETIFDAYQRPGGFNTIRQDLLGKVDNSIRWNEMTETNGPQGAKVTNSPVFDWVMKYLQAIWSESVSGNRESWLNLRNAIQALNTPTDREKQKRLQHYHKVVSMAGHFSV